MKPSLLDIARVGLQLAGPIYSWVVDPNAESKQAVMDALDGFRRAEHDRALAKIRKKYRDR